MNLYYLIAGLALYGDLSKRVLGASAALLLVYATFGLITLICYNKAYAEGRAFRGDDNRFSIVSLALIGVYLLQLLTNFNAQMPEAELSAFYIILPLTYLVTIAQRFPHFDLDRFAEAFLLLMPPIVVVGLIQYFVDETFMIDTSYDETGGIVMRNFVDVDSIGSGDTYFKRFPSLVASADRLSSVGMMHMFFCVLTLRRFRHNMTRGRVLWLAASFVSALAVLMIAGARSRILVVGIAMAVAAAPALQNMLARLRERRSSGIPPIVVGGLLLLLLGGGAFALGWVGGDGAFDSLPILRHLNATAEKGDIWIRIEEYITVSSMPEDVTMFGEGLGAAGVGGRPGEIALRAMWIESGVFWTVFMALLYGAQILFLAQRFIHALRQQASYDIFLSAVVLVMWMLGLMAGLSGLFEASTALTLFPAVAVMTRGELIAAKRSVFADRRAAR